MKSVFMPVDLSVHPLDVILRSRHAFTGSFSVFVRGAGDVQVDVELTPRGENDDRDLAGDFSNALIDAHLRARIAEETRPIRELLVAQAFCEADLLDRRETDADEYEDPRGIAR